MIVGIAPIGWKLGSEVLVHRFIATDGRHPKTYHRKIESLQESKVNLAMMHAPNLSASNSINRRETRGQSVVLEEHEHKLAEKGKTTYLHEDIPLMLLSSTVLEPQNIHSLSSQSILSYLLN